MAIDKLQLRFSADVGVAEILAEARADLNSELETFPVGFQVQERTEMKSQDVYSDQHSEWKIGHNSEFMPNEG